MSDRCQQGLTYLDRDTSDFVAELPAQDFMILCSSEHVVGVLLSCGVVARARLVCTSSIAATTALTTSGSSEAKVSVTKLVKHASVVISVVTRGRICTCCFAQRNLSLQHRALHVINEDGQRAWCLALQETSCTVIGGRVLSWGVGVLTITTVGDAFSMVCSSFFVADTNVVAHLRPVLDLYGVVLAIGQIWD